MWKGWLIVTIDKDRDIQVVKLFEGESRNIVKQQIIEFLKKDNNSIMLKYKIDILLKSPENPLLKPIFLPYTIEETLTPMITNLNKNFKNTIIDKSFYQPINFMID